MSTLKKSPHKLLWLALLTLIVTSCSAAQDASKSYSRAVINRGAIVPAESVRVHEYLNYYDQRFPEPLDQPLGLDLRLGNTHIPTAGGEVWASRDVGDSWRQIAAHLPSIYSVESGRIGG